MEECSILDYRLKENSYIARLAAAKLRSSRVAIVIGRTIYLHHTNASEFLSDPRWVKHELCHVRQFAKYGTVPFIIRYLWESIRHGYQDNKYEREARECEKSA